MLTLPLAAARRSAPTAVPRAPIVTVMEDIAVSADEPRFVAPTRRDRIGRIWAPVASTARGRFASCSTRAQATPR